MKVTDFKEMLDKNRNVSKFLAELKGKINEFYKPDKEGDLFISKTELDFIIDNLLEELELKQLKHEVMKV